MEENLQKRLIFSIILMVFITAATTWAADSAQSSPVSDMFPETSFRFDPVVEGSEVVHDFVVQNKSTEVLTINQVKTG
jgi:hypothetical protein